MRFSLWLLLFSTAALATCGPAPVEIREYKHLGNLRGVRLYGDPRDAAEECYRRTGGVGDDGKPFPPGGTNACTDEAAGVIRVDERASVRDFLHELCHVENPTARSFCDRSYPGGR